VSFGIWDALAVAAKAVAYAATLASAGGVFFLAYNRALLDDGEERAVGRLLLILIGVSLAASGAHVMLTAASMSGDASGLMDGGLMRLILKGGEGRALLVRAAGLLIAARGVISRGQPQLLALAAAGVAATSFVWLGHVHALKSMEATLLGVIHLLGVAFWVGALGPLLLVARHDLRRVAAVTARFGRAAIIVVSALIVAGLGLLLLLVGSVSELWSSSYGRGLTLKLALVACLLSFAAYNRLRLTPRLLAGDSTAVRGLRRSIGAEMILASLILIVTAAFTTLTGPTALE
jgi:copper resistance protein D